MKDKLFWFALIVGGFILFNKYASTSSASTAQVEERQERQAEYPDRGNQGNTQSNNEKTVDAGKYGELKLPRKEGASTSTSASKTNSQKDKGLRSKSTEKRIDAGEYGTLNLPSKNNTASSSSGGNSSSSSSYNGNSSSTSNSNSNSTTSTSRSKIVKLNPETEAGSIFLKEVYNKHRLVLRNEVLQLSNCHKFNIYIDAEGYCNGNNISGCDIYVKKGGELILSRSSLQNNVVYEDGAIIKTTDESIRNNDFNQVATITFE